ncbi:MAG: Nicotinate phosphoribosyltransferase (EC 6.3.4.21) [Olavius algarvensis Delta 4 endosymbiont]|nr:MAG: Nicotinate phosphoribosyltransferase (EC 6.3.4.21) [Olavius algarvensis Delta 4 endosymbiont]
MPKYPPVSALFTDFYELTMAAGYFANDLTGAATFSVSVRPSDRKRGYYVAAGLEDVLDILANFAFTPADLEFLRSTGSFSPAFLSFLADLRFTGDVVAMPEGTLFFPGEPFLEITAPIIEAQLLETVVLNTVGFQTMIATKAARCVHAAQGHPLVDFSLRRTQARDAGMKAARSTWLAGFMGTSNVLAGKTLGIPITGTMAHSFVTAFDSEREAFMAYARLFPDATVLLIDTYDLIRGAENAVQVARYLQENGHRLIGVRLDSGDMITGSHQVREVLDRAGFAEVKIYASSGFDEYKIAELLRAGALIDAFGVGTKVGVSADAPFLDIVYKLARYGDRDVKKFSPGKISLAGRKQVFRNLNAAGRPVADIIGTRREAFADAVALLEPVMRAGHVLGPSPTLADIRIRCGQNIAELDVEFKSLQHPADFPIRISDRLSTLQRDQSSSNPE